MVRDDDGYYEAYYSIFDGDQSIEFQYFPSEEALIRTIDSHWPIQRLKWFSRGFYSVSRSGDAIVISDLRMGLEPDYVFRFKVGEVANPHPKPVRPEQLQANRDLSLLRLVWARIWDPGIRLSP